MKKTLSMLLALVMLFSLCACSNSDTQTTDPSNSSQTTTNNAETSTGNTEKPADGTEGTTGATQAPTDEPISAPTGEATTGPTDEPTTPPTQAPTEAPTTPPTQEPTETLTTSPTTQPTTCSHNWKNATCIAPKTCSKCGATEGSVAGHSWNNATCTAPKTCSKCNATEGSATGHSWNNATCTAPKTCKTCGATEGRAAEHNWSDATCTDPKTCSKCGETEGNIGDHKYSNGICVYCNKTERINPKVGLKENCDYYHVSTGDGYYCLTIYRFYDSSLHIRSDPWGVYITKEEWKDHDGDIITYKGETYYPVGYGGPLPEYTLTDEEIILKYSDPSLANEECKLIINSEYDLVVTYSTDGRFKVGDILDLVE